MAGMKKRMTTQNRQKSKLKKKISSVDAHSFIPIMFRSTCRVIDGSNITMSDEHMWLIPFSQGHNHVLSIDFPDDVLIAGLRIWNYNKSKEDTYRGVGSISPC